MVLERLVYGTMDRDAKRRMDGLAVSPVRSYTTGCEYLKIISGAKPTSGDTRRGWTSYAVVALG